MTTRRSETVQQWVSALEGMGRTVKQQGGYWMAQCPAHDDSNPSMQIKDKGDGTASVECYAGCDFVDILKAVGFYGARSDTPAANQAPAPAQARQAPAKEPPKPQPLPNGKNVTAYYYTTADPDEIVFAVIRRERANGKTFSQWTPVPESGKEGVWLPVAPSSNRPMYFLPDVLRNARAVLALSRERNAPTPCEMHGRISQ